MPKLDPAQHSIYGIGAGGAIPVSRRSMILYIDIHIHTYIYIWGIECTLRSLAGRYTLVRYIYAYRIVYIHTYIRTYICIYVHTYIYMQRNLTWKPLR